MTVNTKNAIRSTLNVIIAEGTRTNRSGVKARAIYGSHEMSVSRLRFQSDATPLGCRSGAARIASGEEHGELVRGESLRGLVRRRGPPTEASLGQPFVTQPETLAVVD